MSVPGDRQIDRIVMKQENRSVDLRRADGTPHGQLTTMAKPGREP
ncbi:MAG: hypothetical protein R2744_10565 [Bacteroidales bacterium]